MSVSVQYPGDSQSFFYIGTSGPFLFGTGVNDPGDGGDLDTIDDELVGASDITAPAPVFVVGPWMPTNRGHMATKGYVDDLVAGSGLNAGDYFMRQLHVLKREGAGGPPTDYVYLNPSTASPMNRPVVLYHEDPYKGLIHPSLLPDSAIVTPADLVLGNLLGFADGDGVGKVLNETSIYIDPTSGDIGQIVGIIDAGEGAKAVQWIDAPEGGGGAETFLELTDTPSAYTGVGGYLVAVNTGATALEFVTMVDHTHEEGSGGVLDHGGLSGLADDDHEQYVKLLGRGAGQILHGGVFDSGSLTLKTTSGETAGTYFMPDLGVSDGLISYSGSSGALGITSVSGLHTGKLEATSPIAVTDVAGTLWGSSNVTVSITPGTAGTCLISSGSPSAVSWAKLPLGTLAAGTAGQTLRYTTAWEATSILTSTNSAVYVTSANTGNTFYVDRSNDITYMRGKATASQYTSNLVTNGTFDTDLTGWTGGGSGWAQSSGTALHSSGTTALTQSISVTANTNMYVAFTLAGRTAGSVTVTLGSDILYTADGVSALTAAATYYRSLRYTGSTGSADLSFTPTDTFDGSIDNVHVQAAVTSGVITKFVDDDGSIAADVRCHVAEGATNVRSLGIGPGALPYMSVRTQYCVAVGYASSNYMVSGYGNTSVGYLSLYTLNFGNYNTAVGFGALQQSTQATYNTGLGAMTGNRITIGYRNTCLGYNSGYNITTGSYNLSAGYASLGYTGGTITATGAGNVCLGSWTGMGLTSGSYNSFIGYNAGQAVTEASYNILIGYNAGSATTTGGESICIGNGAGRYNQTGTKNVYIGTYTGLGVTGNSNTLNTAVGYSALNDITTGAGNVAIGYETAGTTTTGSYNIVIGYDLDTSGATASYELNIGGAIKGNLSAGVKSVEIVGALVADSTTQCKGRLTLSDGSYGPGMYIANNQSAPSVSTTHLLEAYTDKLYWNGVELATAGGSYVTNSANTPNIYAQDAEPGSPSTGTLWFETDAVLIKRYNGSTWTTFSGSSTFLGLTDTPASFSKYALPLVNSAANALEWITKGTDGQVLTMYTDGAGDVKPTWRAATSGITTFLGLSDTPAAYTSCGGYVLRVDSTPDAVEFVAPGNLTSSTAALIEIGTGTSAVLTAATVGIKAATVDLRILGTRDVDSTLTAGWYSLSDLGISAEHAHPYIQSVEESGTSPLAIETDENYAVTIAFGGDATSGKILRTTGAAVCGWETLDTTLANGGAAFGSTGFLVRSGANQYTIDNSTYLTAATAPVKSVAELGTTTSPITISPTTGDVKVSLAGGTSGYLLRTTGATDSDWASLDTCLNVSTAGLLYRYGANDYRITGPGSAGTYLLQVTHGTPHSYAWVSTSTYQAALTTNALTATGPLSLSGAVTVIGSGAAISIPAANGSTNGYLTSTDWTTFNNKQAALTTGALSASAPVSVTGSRSVIGGAATISITQSGSASNGYLSSTDWNTFNNKQAALTTNALTATSPLSLSAAVTVIGAGAALSMPASGAASSGYLTSTDWNTFNNKQNALTTGTISASSPLAVTSGRSVIGGAATVSMTAGTAGQTLYLRSSGSPASISWAAAPVTSVFGRTGAVVATSGDYTTTLVTEGTNLYFTNERVDDRVAALLVAGTGISIVYEDNDVAPDTLTISATVGGVGGSGTIGKLPKWTAGTTLGDSLVSESGSTVTVTGTLNVSGLSFSRPVMTDGSKNLISSLINLTTATHVAIGSAGFLKSSGTLHSWAAVSLATGDTTGTLPLSKFTRGASEYYPLCSNGSAADPSYQVLRTEGGGTGTSINSGTILDGDLLIGVGGFTQAFQRLARSSTQYNVLTATGSGTQWGTLNLASSNAVGTSVLSVVNGGTGRTTLPQYNVLCGNATGLMAYVAPSADAGKALVSNGSTAFPSFGNVSLTYTTGTLPVNRGGTGQVTLGAGHLLVGNGTSGISSLSYGTFNSYKVVRVNPTGSAFEVGMIELDSVAVTGTLSAGKGGTGQSAWTTGQLLYASNTNTLSKLNKGTAYQLLRMKSDASNVEWGAVNLGSGNAVTGTLLEANGGTGESTYTTGDILYANGTNSLAKLGIGAEGKSLKVVSGIPGWGDVSAEFYEPDSPYLEVISLGADFQPGGYWSVTDSYQLSQASTLWVRATDRGSIQVNDDIAGEDPHGFVLSCPYTGKGTVLKEIEIHFYLGHDNNEVSIMVYAAPLTTTYPVGTDLLSGGFISKKRTETTYFTYVAGSGLYYTRLYSGSTPALPTITFGTAYGGVIHRKYWLEVDLLRNSAGTPQYGCGIAYVIWRFEKITYS